MFLLAVWEKIDVFFEIFHYANNFEDLQEYICNIPFHQLL